MSYYSSNQWLSTENITNLNQILSTTFIELKDYLCRHSPDIMRAIERMDMIQIRIFTTELRRLNPFLRVDSLDEFLICLQRIRINSIRSNEARNDDQKTLTTGLPVIECHINGTQIDGLIDTGAQTSIMSKDLAEKCHIVHLIDQRYETKAFGVGEQRVIGKIHFIEVEINSCPMNISLAVVQSFHSNYFLIGQDFLKQHQCVIYCSDSTVLFKAYRLLVRTKLF